jgi:hypothetical protein
MINKFEERVTKTMSMDKKTDLYINKLAKELGVKHSPLIQFIFTAMEKGNFEEIIPLVKKVNKRIAKEV